MTSTRSTREAGLTLIELMVVVAIVGLLVTGAMMNMSREPSALDVAHELASFIGEASRKAVSGGPPSSDDFPSPADYDDFAATYGPAARTQIRVEVVGGYQIAVLERYNESDNTWVMIAERTIRPSVELVGISEAAALEPGGTPGALPADTDAVVVCHADGGCNRGASGLPVTLFLREVLHPEVEARVVVLSLQRGTPLVDSAW